MIRWLKCPTELGGIPDKIELLGEFTYNNTKCFAYKFSKSNFKDILESVKEKLMQYGFTWTDNGPGTYEQDTGYYHVPVNFCAESYSIFRT